jgi:Rad3-related DNA helicase
MSNILECCPANWSLRPKQIEALQWVEQQIANGVKNLVLELPTGTGKTLIGYIITRWIRRGYLLTHQKMLQDQYLRDFKDIVDLKSAVEYPCASHGNCGIGILRQKQNKSTCESCPYRIQKRTFLSATTSLTNYSYILTEREYVGVLESRPVVVFDEAHLLEKVLLGHIDCGVDTDTVKKWAKGIPIPEMKNIKAFVDWIDASYIPEVKFSFSILSETRDESNGSDSILKELLAMEQHINKLERFVGLVAKDPKNWVFWYEDDPKSKVRKWVAKPIIVSPFFEEMLGSIGTTRIFLSAYPGIKKVFCRSIGLNNKEVGWLKLSSNFPLENRPVFLMPVGSMNFANKSITTPKILKKIAQIASLHINKGENGVIHCHSYALGTEIYNYLVQMGFASNLLYPTKADDREAAVNELIKYAESDVAKILISPSVTEGYDFAGPIARWQIIPKAPYANLKDKQVEARMNADKEWYSMQTVMTVIQACGRGVRNDQDYCKTYILDQDLCNLYHRNNEMFPEWFQEAVVDACK